MTMDMIGKTFNQLTVLKQSEDRIRPGINWLCVCSCGKNTIATTAQLKSNDKKSCGCSKLKFRNLIGLTFGKLLVLECLGKNEYNERMWRCRCDCGNIKDILGESLTTGHTKSCGCYRLEQLRDKVIVDITGFRFGKLLVLEKVIENNSRVKWLCKCDCGNIKKINGENLKSGNTLSCGCYKLEKIHEKNFKNLTGQKFGKLLVIEFCEKNKHGQSMWNCSCDCGKKLTVAGFALITKNSMSCGCSLYTKLEKFVEEKLNIKKFNRKALNNSVILYKPDFKLNNNLFLEVDGLYWHSEQNKDKSYHFNKRIAFESEYKRILQFYEDELYNKWSIVESIIKNAQDIVSFKICAEECALKQVYNEKAEIFFEQNNLLNHCKIADHIGLYSGDELVSCLSYTANKKKNFIEIVRFNDLINVMIIDGFSKLLKELENIAKENNINQIVSFCDLRYANGHHYELNGFIKDGVDLDWCWSDGKNRFDKTLCRNINGKTEKRWFKIYDAGRIKYIKILKESEILGSSQSF